MNNKDKEAFENWHFDNVSNPPTLSDLIEKAWSEACLYKQKEIDKIKDTSLNHLIIERFMEHNEKLQAENARLKQEIDELKQKLESVEIAYKSNQKAALLSATISDKNRELENKVNELYRQLKHEHDLYKKHLKIYEDENAKLRECVEFYADEANQIAPIYKHDGRNRPGADFTAPYRMDEGKLARQVLKELEEK